MSLPLPGSLTPSKVTSFRECAFAFRLSVIDKIPQPSNIWTLRGSLAHHVLDRLYYEHRRGHRSLDTAKAIFDDAWESFRERPSYAELLVNLSDDDLQILRATSWQMVENDFCVERPNEVKVLGTELLLETTYNGIRMRGIIDRLDLNPDGTITVTDYKTGRVPSEAKEQDKLIGVHFYSMLCEEVLGVRPSTVQLLYLKNSTSIVAHPTEQSSRALLAKTGAIWRAVEHACQRDDFKPRPSRLCSYCSYQTICPASSKSQSDTKSLMSNDKATPSQL